MCVCACVCVRVLWAQLLSLVGFFVASWTVAHQAPLSMEFSRQEYWSGLPFSSPGDLPSPGVKPSQVSYVSCIGRRILYPCPTWEAHVLCLLSSEDSPCPLECYAMTETSDLTPDGSVWHGLALRPSPASIPLLTLPQWHRSPCCFTTTPSSRPCE